MKNDDDVKKEFFTIDEYGRTIIEDTELLEYIAGAGHGCDIQPKSVNGACGNGAC